MRPAFGFVWTSAPHPTSFASSRGRHPRRITKRKRTESPSSTLEACLLLAHGQDSGYLLALRHDLKKTGRRSGKRQNAYACARFSFVTSGDEMPIACDGDDSTKLTEAKRCIRVGALVHVRRTGARPGQSNLAVELPTNSGSRWSRASSPTRRSAGRRQRASGRGSGVGDRRRVASAGGWARRRRDMTRKVLRSPQHRNSSVEPRPPPRPESPSARPCSPPSCA